MFGCPRVRVRREGPGWMLRDEKAREDDGGADWRPVHR